MAKAFEASAGSAATRGALFHHLSSLRECADEFGLKHLSQALEDSITRLESEPSEDAALAQIEALASRYEVLASMSFESGTHRLLPGAEASTLREVVERLISEIRRGLLDAADGHEDTRVRVEPLNELLAPVWAAIARLRVSIEQRSHSIIHFNETLGVPVLSLTATGSDALEPPDVDLRNHNVLVADDDATVRWFYAKVLREAGAEVAEATNGVAALQVARERPPDAILAHILMPRLDGIGLSEAVRLDPALEGVPVLLLSRGEDFLDRVRELRAAEAPSLCNHPSATQILARLGSLLEPHRRIQAALRSSEDVRGDLGELSVTLLFRWVRSRRPDARVVLQDPWSLFEARVARGTLVELTRTSIDGAVSHGRAAIPLLVGAKAGRFVVTSVGDDADAPEQNSLQSAFETAVEELGATIRQLRAHPERSIVFAPGWLETYRRDGAYDAEEIVQRLVDGETPEALRQAYGPSSSELLDSVLLTLARQGAITAVAGAGTGAEAEVGAEAAKESESASESGAETESGSETETETESGTESGSETESGTESGTETETGTATATATETETESETATGTEMATETETATETGTAPESESEPGSPSGSEPEHASPSPTRSLPQDVRLPRSRRKGDLRAREDKRAQATAALRMQPTNPAPKLTHSNDRSKVAESADDGVRFGPQMQTGPGLLGWVFVLLLSATAGFLVWRSVSPLIAAGAGQAQPGSTESSTTATVPIEVPPPEQMPTTTDVLQDGVDLSRYAGRLQPFVDPGLGVEQGQGVLDLSGSREVSVAVDGVDRGALPVRLVLDEGRHEVVFRVGEERSHRFYYVREHATRIVSASTREGGFVDAR